MDLIKKIHSDVLRLKLHPDESREKHHAFLTGVHSAAAAVSRYKEAGEKLDTAIGQMDDVIQEIDDGKLSGADWDHTVERVKGAVRLAKEALGFTAAESPPIIEDLTVNEILDLAAYTDKDGKEECFLNVFSGIWEDGTIESVAGLPRDYFERGANTLLASFKAAGYVRIKKP